MSNKAIYKKQFIVVLFLGIAGTLLAQTEHSVLLEGNRAYQDGNFSTAIDYFQKALDKNETSLKGHYNLGNALYKDKQYAAASSHYQQAATQAPDKTSKANALYNLGNSYLAQAQAAEVPGKESQEQLKSAIDAYKDALRNNPQDFEAKNNLASAYKLLRQQQPPKNQQDQQNKEQQDQQDQSDQNDQQDQDSEQGDQQKDKQEGEEEKQPPSQDPNEEQPIDNTNEDEPRPATPEEISRAEAKRLLQVIEEADKEVQERLMQRQQRRPQKGEKTW